MNSDYIVTAINRVIMVDKDEYPEVTTVFKSKTVPNELIFNFSGKSTVYFNGEVLKTTPGTLRFLPNGEVKEYIVEREENGECIDIQFYTDRPISPVAFVLDMQNNVKVSALFKQIFSVWVAKNDGYYFECISLLYKILSEMQKNDYIPEKQYLIIKPAVDHIFENFHKTDISVEKLAELCNVSYSYFKRLFIKKYRVSPKQYIIRLKLNFACDLIRQGDISFTRIAEQCGFSDIYFFSRQFKAYTGITPTEYREKYKSSK